MEEEKQDLTPSEDRGGGSGPGPDGHPCAGCFHWRGWSENSICCNYIFDEDRRRPCPPGAECTVKRPRGKGERARIRELKKLR